MSVYFIYRSYYEGPAVRRLRIFPEDTILEWFQNHWQGADPDKSYAEELLGGRVYGFDCLFWEIDEEKIEMPRSNQELKVALEEHLGVVNDFRFNPHVVQVCTDDDETEMAYYFFDDVYLEKHRSKAAFLLNEDWRLPIEADGQGGFEPTERLRKLGTFGKGPGQTYLAVVSHDLEDLQELRGAVVLDGVRLPELIPALIDAVTNKKWPLELLSLRLLASSKDLPLSEVLSRVARHSDGFDLSDFQLKPEQFAELQRKMIQGLDADLGQSLIHVGQHVTQLIEYLDDWEDDGGFMYRRWFLFDDVWASQHKNLANGILRFVARWDVLT